MFSDESSSGVGSVDGGTGVPFSMVLRLRRPLAALRATFFPAGVLRVAILRPDVFLRAAVLRVAVLRPAVFRAAVLRAADLQPAVFRIADLRPVVLRAPDFRRVVIRAAVLRGRPGLRLLGMAPLVMLFRSDK
jgi:hypothetical protein